VGIYKKSKRQLQRSTRKVSEYGLQLKEKQKAKFIYGVLEKQFRLYFEKAAKTRGVVGENLLTLLELRIDNAVYRLGFARTRREARQMVSHKLFKVNGKSINIPSYQLKAGDVLQVREKSKSSQRFKDVIDSTGSVLVPDWLSADRDGLKGVVISSPRREQIDTPVAETLIVELYSK
jgi:small subunit ribosomal protein S4